MPGKEIERKTIKGLSAVEVLSLREQFGKNIFQSSPPRRMWHIVRDLIKDPMFILLLVACFLYFILGEASEGVMMLVAIILVAAISIYQEVKSSHAVEALKQFSEPKIEAIRDEHIVVINAEELVPGDVVLLKEGMKIPADAIILNANDLTVDESIITGESVPVEKYEKEGSNLVYQGTTINSGKCEALVTKTGNKTVLGKLGLAVGAYQLPKTLLQKQVNVFVKGFALVGFAGFIIIFLVNFFHYREWAVSLLFALTLAMSVIPEEIPVAFSSFMALGSFKMSRLGIISRQPHVIENLGAVSVICFDKTGTITENKMKVKTIYDYGTDELIDLSGVDPGEKCDVLRLGTLASEMDPFDSMEKAIVDAYHACDMNNAVARYKMIHEYPLEGRPPMMTHVYENEKIKVAAAKGGVEKIIDVCHLPDGEKKKIIDLAESLASKGFRVLGVAGAAEVNLIIPVNQEGFNWQFKGLIALYDPPKQNVTDVIRQFQEAKIIVKLVTGDYPQTALNIAGQTGIPVSGDCVTGDEVMKMDMQELRQVVMKKNVFARMFPEAKLKMITALKSNGEIVAMTGDGVNDGPALKEANIGIAMGLKGTEIARQAADLILTDDNMERIVRAVWEGRKIYSNLKKAIRYIISIHIPIILTASLPLIFGWMYPNIFTPVHVIFLELIMGPTCSIFFEREPVDQTIMQQPPREKQVKLFKRTEFLTSIIQGLVIAGGILGLYYFFMDHGAGLEETRTIVFTTLILANIFLTFTNRSFTRTIFHTSKYKNNLALPVLIVSIVFLGAILLIPPVNRLFQLTSLHMGQFWICLLIAFLSVMWFEVRKAILLWMK